MKQVLFLIKILLFTYLMPSSGQLHWESVVLESDLFSYLVPESEPPADWMQTQFDDTDWQTAKGGFGYGDGDDQTIVPATTSLYLRKEVAIPSSLKISQLLLDIDYDDAFVAYINGVEVARSQNLESGPPRISGSVTYDHEARMYQGGSPERFILNPEILVDGNNLLAIHILNISLNSSDMSARIFLNAELDSDQLLFNETPDWFTAPVNYNNSSLPLVKIDTDGLIIPDDPKITASMKVIDNMSGKNSFDDTIYTYNGLIGIEIRGNTSQMFPKKSYSVETRLVNGENNNVPLMRMPVENDWVFYAPYSDKSLMRNVLAYNIGNAMGREWHPRTRFFELELNNEYRGVYLLAEKIKIDNDRVDLPRLQRSDISGDELTGGYIISIDRHQENSWISPFMGRTGSVEVPFSYVRPRYDSLVPEQRAYIRNYITDFEYALHGNNYKDRELGYRKYIDLISFIDYFIITELSKDLDGYRVSVFMHKDRDSNGGKLTMTPFWDYNIAFGNANFFSAGNPEGWASDGIGAGDMYEIPFWWDKFRTDPYFESLLKHRWQELRNDVISKDRIRNVIDSVANLLAQPQVKNFETWNILDSYVWPNNYVGGSYSNEVDYLNDWINQRIDWLDMQIDAIEAISLSRPSVVTAEAANITDTSVIVGGFVADDGYTDIQERGLYFGTSPDPRKDGVKINLGKGSGNFTMQPFMLKPGMKHYYQAFAANDLGTGYGKIESFNTQTGHTLPAVASLNASNITGHSATVGGNVINDGGAPITERGFFYGTESTPETNGMKVTIDTGEDIFYQKLTGLEPSTDYFVRAFAVNKLGMNYGAIIGFTTLKTGVGTTNHIQQDSVWVSAYPVPFTESLTIGVNLSGRATVEIVMADLLGRIVSMQARECGDGYNQFIFGDKDAFNSSSIYFFTVLIDGIPTHKRKVLKQ